MSYNELYPTMLINFCEAPVYKKKKDNATGMMVKIPWEYPTISDFRVKNKIPRSKRDYWVKNYPELSEAIEIVKDMQEDMLMKNGLAWRWNAQVVKNVGMADHNWSEKKETVTKQAIITEEQQKKMFEDYMEKIKQDWMVLDWEIIDDWDKQNSI